MNDKVRQIFFDHISELNSSDEDILAVLEDVAQLYDRECGTYPEHEYEGLAFYMFCKEGSFPWADYDDFDIKDEWWKELNEPDIPCDTADKAADVEED